ncbi:MAG TPA: hypothetical protein VHH34_15170 [Pseudonocardiaceae bacterium]|nr:hypothetical protein [Pseudonocardiaceae bacterium]
MTATPTATTEKLPKKIYEREMLRLQRELVEMQEWVRSSGTRLVVVFEGRDAAGKGGAIQRVAEYLNPRVCRIVALPAPTERQRTQWYFQRYIEHLPAAWEIVLFDKRRARINMVAHLLASVPYRHVERPALQMPERPPSRGYQRPPREQFRHVPDHAATLSAD